MKSSAPLLFVSLLANVGLLITLFIAATPAPTSTHDTVTASSHPRSALAETSAAANSSASLHASPTGRSLWPILHTEDIDQLTARLKGAGFTYGQIRAIVYQVGGKKFETAEEELYSHQPNAPYWKTSDGRRGKEFHAKIQAIMEERSAFYRKYLNGPEWLAKDEESAEYARQQYGPLPIEKLQAVSRIQNDYSDLSAKMRAERMTRTNTRLSKEDRQKHRLLERELEHDLQQVLTPEEFAEYQLRESPTAQRLREQLELLRPSETEYKTLFALQRSIDQQFDIWSPDKEGQDAYQDAVKELTPQIEAALGPDRYADYKQLTASPNDPVTVLMSRLELPLATAGKIAALRDSASAEADAIRNDAALSSPDREVLLANLAQQTEARLGTLLRTPRGLEAYTDLKGDWLRALHPKPAPSSP